MSERSLGLMLPHHGKWNATLRQPVTRCEWGVGYSELVGWLLTLCI